MNPGPLHRNTRRVVAAAAELGVTIQVRRFPAGTRTAADAAAAIGCDLGAIVKSLVLASDAGPLLVLTSGRNQVDYDKVAAAVGAGGVRRADADAARAATGFPIGGTPPFGHQAPLAILCDADLLGYQQIWAAAGTPDTVFPLPPDRLLAATGAEVADVAQRPLP
ncbi:YbaK/EbsC family protein [soil metagenome]